LWQYDQSRRVVLGVSYTPHPALARLIPLVDGLAHAFGPDSEIVLHDLRHPSTSLIHIAGSLTGRSPGAPLTNVVLESLLEHRDEAADLFNYQTLGSNGQTLRSSTLFIRDSGRIIGALCVNIDVSFYRDLEQTAAKALAFESTTGAPAERFGNTVGEVLDDLLATILQETRIQPSRMSADDRMRVVASLEERGVFLIKGAIEMIAQRLGVSRFTVYGYLKRVRAAKTLEVPSRVVAGVV
jgi:predicted transcriptional regulator YheO